MTMLALHRGLVSTAYRARQAAMRYPMILSHLALGRLGRRRPARPEVVREIRQRYERLMALDLDNALSGVYPPRLLFHPPLVEHARALPELARQLPSTLARMRRGDFKDLPASVPLESYPAYYRRNFHWQTDGYLSERSARVYDAQVEWVFVGAAGAMRRQVLPPILEFTRGSTSPRILDVACGTGITLDLLSRALPGASLAGIDLSPYYVEQATRRLRRTSVDLRAGNAETLPWDDNSFDVVTSTYLFHELPRRIRTKVIAEMARVLRPEGLWVVQDSAQRADSEGIGEVLEGFGSAFHEPYYSDYLRDPLEARVTDADLALESSQTHFLAKVVVGRKPAAASA